jgi:hypothetical protein
LSMLSAKAEESTFTKTHCFDDFIFSIVFHMYRS